MRRAARGLTLIEVLAALALLGLMAAVLSSWLQITGAFVAHSTATLPWESAAEQVMQRIQEDLLIGDFVHSEKDVRVPRCGVVDGRLTIRTRAPGHGPAQREYRFESHGGEGRLDQVTRSLPIPGEHAETRRLVGDVAAWTSKLHPNTQILTVSLTSTTGRMLRRSFACPP